jgi:hypothetical protein
MKKRRTLAASPRRAFWGPETPRPISFVSEARCKQAQRKVLLSFARHGRCKPQSFPRKACPELAEGQESTRQTFGNALSTDGIPAFVGMTGVSKGVPSQMTPTPSERSSEVWDGLQFFV